MTMRPPWLFATVLLCGSLAWPGAAGAPAARRLVQEAGREWHLPHALQERLPWGTGTLPVRAEA